MECRTPPIALRTLLNGLVSSLRGTARSWPFPNIQGTIRQRRLRRWGRAPARHGTRGEIFGAGAEASSSGRHHRRAIERHASLASGLVASDKTEQGDRCCSHHDCGDRPARQSTTLRLLPSLSQDVTDLRRSFTAKDLLPARRQSRCHGIRPRSVPASTVSIGSPLARMLHTSRPSRFSSRDARTRSSSSSKLSPGPLSPTI